VKNRLKRHEFVIVYEQEPEEDIHVFLKRLDTLSRDIAKQLQDESYTPRPTQTTPVVFFASPEISVSPPENVEVPEPEDEEEMPVQEVMEMFEQRQGPITEENSF
jgi:hypothetical protein